MSHFLQNLITRHQENGVNPIGSHIVQPRPKSRFENDSNAGAAFNQHSQDIEPIVVDNQSSHGPIIAPRHPTNADNLNQSISHLTDNENELISALILPREPKFITQETTNFINKKKEQTEFAQKTELSPETTDQSHSQVLSPGDELNQRIQTILFRLNSQQPQRTDKPLLSEPRQHSATSSTAVVFDKNQLTGSGEFHIKPEEIFGFEQQNSAQKQNIGNRATQREIHQTGSLQAPDWLTKMQSDLNSRWREMNTQGKSEPVVNVTIGRVEVRADHEEPVKQNNPQNKPSGIMSLDDYLNQRNKGRS